MYRKSGKKKWEIENGVLVAALIYVCKGCMEKPPHKYFMYLLSHTYGLVSTWTSFRARNIQSRIVLFNTFADQRRYKTLLPAMTGTKNLLAEWQVDSIIYKYK